MAARSRGRSAPRKSASRPKAPRRFRVSLPWKPLGHRLSQLVWRRPVIAATVVALSLIGLVAFIWPAPPLGTQTQRTLLRLFGLGGPLVLLGSLGAGWRALRARGGEAEPSLSWSRALAALGLIIALFGALALLPLPFGLTGMEDPGAGGEFGRLILSVLSPIVSRPGALVLLLVLGGITLGYLAAVGPERAWPLLRAPLARAAGHLRSRREERALREAALRALAMTPPAPPRPRSVIIRTSTGRATIVRPDEDPDPEVPAPTPMRERDATSATIVTPPAEESLPVVPRTDTAGWALPSLELLDAPGAQQLNEVEIRKKVEIIEETLDSFGVPVKVVEVSQGPTITQFGLEPGFDVKTREIKDRTGKVVSVEEVARTKVKVARITALANDLALALAAPTIRIEAPVPGRAVVGIEVPNTTAAMVTLRGVIESPSFQRLRARTKVPLALGQDVGGQSVSGDLARMPHLLIAGSTGSGKSVCINGIIACLLMHATPDEVRLLMIDPKRVELAPYNAIPHLLHSVVVEMDQVVAVLKWVVKEMEDRYKLFAETGARNLEGYNRKLPPDQPKIPYLVVIVDELADLMMTAPDQVEGILCRLAQLARATGIHLVVATQRPSVDVVTGLIKANFPSRIAFAVSSQVDSRTILDAVGAEKLLGRGDMLYQPIDAAKPVRLQGAYVSDKEIDAIVGFWKAYGRTDYQIEIKSLIEQASEGGEDDPMLSEARRIVAQHSRVSVSLLQRRLRIGYNRAARLIETLEDEGLIGPSLDGRSREVLIDGGEE